MNLLRSRHAGRAAGKASVQQAIRRQLIKAAKRLPEPRDEAAKRLLVAGRDLLTGRPPRALPRNSGDGRISPREARRVPDGGHISPVGPPLERTPQLGDTSHWVSPPMPEGHGQLTKVLYDTGAPPPRFDVELLEALNELSPASGAWPCGACRRREPR